MIEFRWYQFHLGSCEQHPSAHILGNSAYAIVLQFRKKEGPEGEEWWGDWKDIPIVEK